MIAGASLAELIPDVRLAIARNNFPLAETAIASYKAQHGATPEMIEAMSWLARGALAARQYDRAEEYAKRTEALVLEHKKAGSVDKDAHLAIALGAAIEVQGLVMNGRGERGSALTYLRKELATYQHTSLRARIQKNIHIIDLVGKPAPMLDEHEWLGPKPPSLAALRGKPVLLFFWAHWCGDCKLERRELSKVKAEFGGKGLVLIGPTQRYGYAAKGQDVTPQEELKYIDEVRNKYYLDLSDMPVPVSEVNMQRYGASTTPTLVLIDRHGMVTMYHPGSMTAEELEKEIRAVI